MSKTKLKNASYSIHILLRQVKLSFQTKHAYKDMLNLCVKHLDKLGFQIDNIRQLKQKHIYALTKQWRDENLNVATIKNRLSTLRYACRLLNKANVVFANAKYSIGNRSYIPTENKAIKEIDLSKIDDLYIKQSIQLQKQFGLRREESIKFNPSFADKGDHIELKASWTKGGIHRIIPITTQEQRECLNQAKELCGKNSLIPQGKSFINQRNLYDRLTHQAGLFNLHGLRHAYAQQRYFTLTKQLNNGNGWQAPLDGGVKTTKLTKQEKVIDRQAREIISRELGHCRIAITKIYLS